LVIQTRCQFRIAKNYQRNATKEIVEPPFDFTLTQLRSKSGFDVQISDLDAQVEVNISR
jgi:hypothetical protein